ncbi:prepilin peptidase [Halarsenatibacter silvermanii]|uniref:Prepilin leader peptidase/N-methyltransferase n=1 Tax=Halarsenatibacter silvermanii TaxID=321763 RepID=A0A1G9LA36_9FIRM|nr:A24 family peptidase [Halarsenatibacter silvermanii]SDL58820.1 leader peptidase (prepilin peptidase) / N-methyltransferase [Halarsenatibacter silvermanii]
MQSFIFLLLGLIVGSFINVLIVRVPRGQSIINPRSHCPDCGHELKAFELIPVLSFILLRGKCRECGVTIPLRYPLVELMTGFLFLANFYLAAEPVELISGMVFITLLLPLSVIDLREQILPDKLNLAGMAAGLTLSFFRVDFTPLTSISGILAGGGFLFALAIISRGGIGGGDIKLMLFTGSFLGAPLVLISIFLAAILGLIASLPSLFRGQMGLKSKLPFGPFLALSALILWYFGAELLSFYLQLF